MQVFSKTDTCTPSHHSVLCSHHGDHSGSAKKACLHLIPPEAFKGAHWSTGIAGHGSTGSTTLLASLTAPQPQSSHRARSLSAQGWRRMTYLLQYQVHSMYILYRTWPPSWASLRPPKSPYTTSPPVLLVALSAVGQTALSQWGAGKLRVRVKRCQGPAKVSTHGSDERPMRLRPTSNYPTAHSATDFHPTVLPSTTGPSQFPSPG
ncbi:hypothetical protein IAQ61_010448 [Plenodomus lingam]|uniref:uncharacterized protein n=1 Tax=Leptosphaeria maculans TaxID=5022 RepID=UPI0033201695|nr:hypothetical protein IAQ61_010448 [Plenodomus lingam]